ncbi:MAG: phosphate transport system regulatory protein PhoU [Betaproteobacteria bacterium RIFCSPLOWO2_02_FULL_66_14]|nr:MAG: phosphate transport system regulatory protein PhoU [Betaproteobacteria bacterium RIFCSPLOWO2_02_FULL_66_14]
MGTTEHISKQFEADLDTTRTRVLQMGGLVEAQILGAIDAFATGDATLADQVIENDARVNGYEVAIDGACNHIVVKRQPAASDLRLTMAIAKIVTDIERIGDEAKKVARMSKRLHEHGPQHAQRFPAIRHTAQIAVRMLRQALDAFARLDAVAAAGVLKDDSEIDHEFRAAVRQLVTYMMEDPRTISPALDIIWVAKAVERMGDHAKNIAEQVIYIVKGTDVRHTSFADIEREIGTD